MTRVEAPAGQEVGAGVPLVWPTEQPWIRAGAEVQPRMGFRVATPPMLPLEQPWINRAADEFWEELQDKVLMDAEPPPKRGKSQGEKIIWTMRIGGSSPRPETSGE